MTETYESVANGHRSSSSWVTVVVVAAIGAALAIATVVGVNLLRGFGEDVDAADAVAVAIQGERSRSVRLSCEQQNARHPRIVKAADQLLADQGAGPEQRAEVRQFTMSLADAVAPVRDCDRVVHRAVRRRE